MPIISAGICNKKGVLLVSRQYAEITQASLLDLYSSFPRLIRVEQQHTLVEDSRNRFLFVPSNELYVAEETLKLFYRVVISISVEGVNERNVERNYFDILLALDDIISFGQRQSVSVEQVVEAVKMNSAKEEAHRAEMLKKSELARQSMKKTVDSKSR